MPTNSSAARSRSRTPTRGLDSPYSQLACVPQRRENRHYPRAVGSYEIEFRWKEEVIYWEGSRGCVFPGGWGVDPVITIVPDAQTWNRAVPSWLHGRHGEVVERLRADARHVVQEERDDSATIDRYREVQR